MTGVIYDGRITLGNVITIGLLVVSGVFYIARMETKNAVQDEQLSTARAILESAIAAETAQRREALQELKMRMDADRAEMRAQFEKLNAKIDKLIENKH